MHTENDIHTLLDRRAQLLAELEPIERALRAINNSPAKFARRHYNLERVLEKMPWKESYTSTELNKFSTHWRRLLSDLKRPEHKAEALALLEKIGMFYKDAGCNSRTFYRML